MKHFLKSIVGLPGKAIGAKRMRVTLSVPARIVKALLILSLVAGIGAGWFAIYQYTNLPAIVRDVVISVVAHYKAGAPVPMDDVDYNRSTPYDPNETWGIATNSKWLTDYALRIIPFYYWERVGGATYPDYVVVIAWPGATSLGVGGRADCVLSLSGEICAVWINERYFNDPVWQDKREVLEVLVHELIHIQGGDFMRPEGESWTEKSAILEAKTSAATLEVLAGMCNTGDELACKSFWHSLESTARQTLRANLRGDDWIYQIFADLFLRDPAESRAAHKLLRDYASLGMSPYETMYKYALVPYQEMMIRWLKDGTRLQTNVYEYNEYGRWDLTMPFDDTQSLLGVWSIWLRLLTK